MATQQAAATTTSVLDRPTAIYEIDPTHTIAEFSVKHMMFTTVKGRFGTVSGEIAFDADDPTHSSVVATAEVASIDTHEPQRDAHLRSPDFFDAEHYPVLRIESRRVEPTGRDGEYRLIADLTIRGVTREVVFDASYLGTVTDPWVGQRIGISAAASINRRDFGLHWNMALEAGGVLVGDVVKINLEIEAVRREV